MNTTTESEITTTDSNQMPARGTPQSAPNIPALISSFHTCSPWSQGGWNRMQMNDDLRFLRWPGQTADCKKKGSKTKPAFPWDDAFDGLYPVADALINACVDYLVVAFWRAWLTPKAGTSAIGNYAVKLLDYLVNTQMTEELDGEVELAAQYLYGYGWVPLYPHWQFEVSLEYKTVTLDDLAAVAMDLSKRLEAALAQGAGMQGPPPQELLDLMALPTLIGDETREAQAIEALDMAWQAYGMQQVGTADINLPPLSRATLRQAVRDLRNNSTAEVPVPYVCKDQPSCRALKPWEEFLLPGCAADIDRVPCFQVDWLSEVDLRAKELTEGWDAGWIAEALKHKGKMSAWNVSVAGRPDSSLANHLSAGTWFDSVYEPSKTPSELVEVVYATYRMVDANSVPGVYLTIFHPLVGKDPGQVSRASSYAWHGLLKDARGRSPYVIGKREQIARTITSSRGVPEICRGWQLMTKAQGDGAVDWTSMGVLPPINEYATAIKTTYKYGPAVRNTVQQGKEPHFMEVPTNGVPVAFEMLERIELWVDGYFGKKNPKLDPTEADTRTQKKVNNFLMLWTRALLRCVDLCQARMDDMKFSQITGAPPGWLEANRGKPGALSARLECDIRELNPEYVAQMLTTINEAVIPQDVSGVTNRTEWTRAQWQMINPRLARSVVQDDGAASAQMFEQVKGDVALMYVGQEPKYPENDPGAKAKLGYLNDIIHANPKYLEALGLPPEAATPEPGMGGAGMGPGAGMGAGMGPGGPGMMGPGAGMGPGGGMDGVGMGNDVLPALLPGRIDPRFRKLVEKYMQSLMFSVQQRNNAAVGRIGVQPQDMQNA